MSHLSLDHTVTKPFSPYQIATERQEIGPSIMRPSLTSSWAFTIMLLGQIVSGFPEQKAYSVAFLPGIRMTVSRERRKYQYCPHGDIVWSYRTTIRYRYVRTFLSSFVWVQTGYPWKTAEAKRLPTEGFLALRILDNDAQGAESGDHNIRLDSSSSFVISLFITLFRLFMDEVSRTHHPRW
jgi:hypothetical protein